MGSGGMEATLARLYGVSRDLGLIKVLSSRRRMFFKVQGGHPKPKNCKTRPSRPKPQGHQPVKYGLVCKTGGLLRTFSFFTPVLGFRG